jgi:hypothetical protein
MKELMAATVLAGVLVSSCSSSSPDAASPGPDTSAPDTTTSSAPATPRQPTELWTAPPNAMAHSRAAGLTPERAEHLEFHVHAHLDVFVNGRPIVVSPGIGINIHDPAVRSFANPDGSTSYGGIDPPCRQVCISPLHTHDPDGVLHTESRTAVPNRLGQFFVEWGVRLTDSCVGQYCAPKTPIAVYLNGRRFDLDPRDIQLTDLSEIAIVIGTPPSVIPSVFPG